ncbi:MAG TPA: GNAT family N-acetyltransferase [Verrucomicrobiae bacterium]|nr:GNAT family N-acetyltransferase [Verrucomicrobiae bacterium]
MSTKIEIKTDDLNGPEIAELLTEHLRSLFEVTPVKSRHALKLEELRQPNITFWSARIAGELAGCAALKELDPEHGEIKSMRTAKTHLRKGVASALMQHILREAKRRGLRRLSLETGAMPYFEPARAMYRKFGFGICGPFNGYVEDSNSVFMTQELAALSFIDLSHTIEHGMITYRGLPAPLICDFLSRESSRNHYAEGTEFHIGRIDMVANTGTYLDSPFHRFADGKDLSHLPLASLAGLEGVLIRSAERAITRRAFDGIDVGGKAVLVQTGWDKHWRTDTYFEGHPFLTEDAATYLKESGAKLVGIDSYNIDDTADGRRPVHTILLRNEIPIVEHMTGLHELPSEGFEFFAVPPKVRAFGTFPVRAFATIQ